MIGITIAIGETFQNLARVSSKCVEEMLNIKTIILTEKDFDKNELKHPTALKLKIFDLIEDENILYFDADWFCVNEWDVSNFQNKSELIICRDFTTQNDFPQQYLTEGKCNLFNYEKEVLKTEIRLDYINDILQFIDLNKEPIQWVNTGMWIANRTNHQDFLKLSLEYYLNVYGHHNQYYEQPVMNKAIEHLKLPLIYLERKYNILVAGRLNWPTDAVGLHVKIKRYSEFLDKIKRYEITNRDTVYKYFIS
jgi:hypothetical protein